MTAALGVDELAATGCIGCGKASTLGAGVAISESIISKVYPPVHVTQAGPPQSAIKLRRRPFITHAAVVLKESTGYKSES